METLIALKEFRHGRQFVAVNDEFSASETDAAYYLRHNMAKKKERIIQRMATRTRAILDAPVQREAPADAPPVESPAE